MIPRCRCCCRVIRRRRPGGCGHTFVMTATPGQRRHRPCGSPIARTEKASTRRPILRSSWCAADAYAGFNELYRNGRITEAACWAHARRKIHDVHVRTPSALTDEALKRIGELYIIEAEIRGIPPEQRLVERQQKTKPLLKSLESWLCEKMKTLSRHSELTKAFAYALNQWPALAYYTEDGWAEADNNIAENALRMVSLGRKTGCSSFLTMVVSGEHCCTA